MVAQHGLAMSENADLDVSYLADSVLLLRYFEVDAQIRQAVSVFKKRTGGHERSLRELQITSKGVVIGEPLVDFAAFSRASPNTPERPRRSGRPGSRWTRRVPRVSRRSARLDGGGCGDRRAGAARCADRVLPLHDG